MEKFEFKIPEVENDLFSQDTSPVESTTEKIPDGDFKIFKEDETVEDNKPTVEELATELLKEEVIVPENNESTEEINEEPKSIEEYGFSNFSPDIAQYMMDNEFITEVPEGVDIESFDAEALAKTIAHNRELDRKVEYERGVKTTYDDIMNRMVPEMRNVINHQLENPNATVDDLRSLLDSVQTSEYLKNLSYEQQPELVVREYYKGIGWSTEDVDNKVDNLIEIGENALTKEASFVQPKLVEIANRLGLQKQNEAKEIKKIEDQIFQTLQQDTIEFLKKGKLSNISINKETASFLYAGMLNQETPVQIGGRTIHMGYAEALMRQEKHNNPERAMLALLILKDGPDAIKKYLGQSARSEEVRQQVKQTKFSNNKKRPSINSQGRDIQKGHTFKIYSKNE